MNKAGTVDMNQDFMPAFCKLDIVESQITAADVGFVL